MGPVYTVHSLAFSPARETKWKSMWRSARIMLHVFVCVSIFELVCMCEMYWVSLFRCILYVNLLLVCLCKRNYARVCFHVVYECVLTDPLKDHL